MEDVSMISSKSRILIIAAALIALFLCAMDALVMSVAMPTILTELGGIHLYAWVYSGFFLTNSIALPIIGKLADLYKTKTLFIISIGLFILSSIAAGLSNSMLALVIARAFQGIGAGGNIALVYIVLSDISPPEKRGKTLALGSVIWGIASVAGPSVGGFITTYLSWRWIFFINVPIGLVSLLGISLLLIETRSKKETVHLDITGALMLAGWVVSGLIIVMAGGSEFPWFSLPSALLALLTIGFAVGFYRAESRAKDPILDLQFFRNRGFAFGNGIAFLTSFTVFSLFAYSPLFIQGAMRRPPLEVGIVMLALSLGWSLGSVLISRFLHLISNKTAVILGASLIAAGMAYTLTFDRSTTMVECFFAFLLVGFGVGFVMLCTLLEVQSTLSAKNLGVATASQQFSRTLGGSIGVGICGGVVTSRLLAILGNANAQIPQRVMEQVSESVESIFRPAFFSELSSRTQQLLQDAVVDAISVVFWILLGLSLLSLAFSMILFLMDKSDRERNN